MELLLKNVRHYDGEKIISGDVRIIKGVVHETGQQIAEKKGTTVVDCSSYDLYPGLINAHDHLEMNLYPRLGSPPYMNYVEWAWDIYKPTLSPIREIEKVNINDRLLWGGLKNLLSGVTTVVHHNPWHRLLGKKEFPVFVLKQMKWAHSLALGKDIQKDFPGDSTTPFVIHAGEGIDALAFSELASLDSKDLLQKNTVLVHAIGVTESGIELLQARGSSVVWCPSSNLFMFNQTAPLRQIKVRVPVALGTDSTLTGSPTLLDEMKVAFKTDLVNAHEIFRMVTRQPSRIFGLSENLLQANQPADFFVAERNCDDYFENLIKSTPADIGLVMSHGGLRLLDPRISLVNHGLKHSVQIDGRLKLTDVDVAALRKQIKRKVGATILEANPLWNLIQA